MALTKIPSSLLDTSGGFDLQGNITLGDNEKIIFGDSSDLQIYHDGTSSVIKDASTNQIYMQSTGFNLSNSSGLKHIYANDSYGVTFYYQDNAKIETTSAGATVTGTLTVTGDLDITGDINSYNVTDLDVTDQTITLGAGQTEANSGGSGIIIDGSNASILWDETNSEFDINNSINVSGSITAGQSISINNSQVGTIQQAHGIASGNTIANKFQVGRWNGSTYDRWMLVPVNDGTAQYSNELGYNFSTGAWFFDNTLGIGTASPTADLSVGSTSTSSGDVHLRTTKTAFSITPSNTDAGGILLDLGWVNGGQGPMKFGLNGSVKMRIDSSGRLLAGKDSVGARSAHTFARTGAFAAEIIQQQTSAGASVLGLTYDGAAPNNTTDYFIYAIDTTGIKHIVRANGDGYFAGKVGIGTTSPSTPLHIENTSSPQLRVAYNGSNYQDLSYEGSDIVGGSHVFKIAGSEKMRLDTSGNLGIGTNSVFDSNTRLELKKSGNCQFFVSSSDASGVRMVASAFGTSFGKIGTYSNHALRFDTNDTERMRIDTSGNVGIGTSSPSAPLHIQTNDSTTNTTVNSLMITNLSTGTTTTGFGGEIRFQAERNSGVNQNTGGIRSIAEVNSGTNISSGMAFDTSTAGVNYERLRITYDGKVGIGTASPLNTLHIYGTGQTTANLAESGNQGGMLKITDANTAAGAGGAILFANYHADDEPSMGFAAIKGVLNNGSTYTQGSLAFSTRNAINGTSMTERMRLKYDGSFGIGTDNPDARLAVVASSVSGGVVKIKDTDATVGLGNTILGLYFSNDDDCSTATFIGMYDSGSRIGSITVTNATSVAFNTTSDYRLKENVNYDYNALDRVAQLKPARFNWINDETNTLVDGFLAHEVQEIVPEAIHGEKDGVREEEYEITPAILDDDGFVATEAVMGIREVPDYQGIDQSKLVPLLTKAIQELKTKLEAAEARITELEG